MKLKCIEKDRDNKGRIINYILEDEGGTLYYFSPDEIKEILISENSKNTYEFTNLQIDKIGRLVNKKDKQVKVVEEQENKGRYTLLAKGVASYTGVNKIITYYKFRDNIENKEIWVNRDDLHNFSKRFRNEYIKGLYIRPDGSITVRKNVPCVNIDSMLFVYMSVKENMTKMFEDLLNNGGFILTQDEKIIALNKYICKRINVKNALKRFKKTLEELEIDYDFEILKVDTIAEFWDIKWVYYGYVETEDNTDTYFSLGLENVIEYLQGKYKQKLKQYNDLADVLRDNSQSDYKLFAEGCKDSQEKLEKALNEAKDNEIKERLKEAGYIQA